MRLLVILHTQSPSEFIEYIVAKYKQRNYIKQARMHSDGTSVIMTISANTKIRGLIVNEPQVQRVLQLPASTHIDDVIDDVSEDYTEEWPISPSYDAMWRPLFSKIEADYTIPSTDDLYDAIIAGGGSTSLDYVRNYFWKTWNSSNHTTTLPISIQDPRYLFPDPCKLLITTPNPRLDIPDAISKSAADPINTEPLVFGGDLPPIPWPATIGGCTDVAYLNFNPNATFNDGTCTNAVLGCTDPFTSNYNPNATDDDGSCIASILGCMDPTATNYNPAAEITDGTCIAPPVYGCTDPMYNEYNQDANTDDGTCTTYRELITQVIPIHPGWNTVGTFINMADEPYANYSIEDYLINHLHLTSDVDLYQLPEALTYEAGDIQSIKNAVGQFWSPATAQLYEIHLNVEGYMIYNTRTTPMYLIFRGNPVTSNILNNDTTLTIPHAWTSVNLSAGWNLMPVLSYTSVDIDSWVEQNTEFNESFESNIQVIKNAVGQFWSPATAQLHVMTPQKAYMIFVHEPMTARFSIPVVHGCTDPEAFNYQSYHQIEDGTCYYSTGVGEHIITLPGRDDMGWGEVSPFSNYMISTYIDLDTLPNNDVQHIFENNLYDENGVQIPVDNIHKYIRRVRDTSGGIYYPDLNISGNQSGTEYNPFNGIGDWNTGDVLMFETAHNQNEAFTLRLEGVPISSWNAEVDSEQYTGVTNALPILATASIDATEYLADSIGVYDNVYQIKDNVTGDIYQPAQAQHGSSLTLYPGKGYVITFYDQESSFTHIRTITMEGGGNISANDAQVHIPHTIEIPPGKSHISSYINMYNPTTQEPYSAHTILYNNLRYANNQFASFSEISSSISYIAIPSYSESFENWSTSSYATPNLDLKWDHKSGTGFEIYNNSAPPVTLYLTLNNPLIQTSSDANGGFTVGHVAHSSLNVTQSLIGAYCVSDTPVSEYFSGNALLWIHHISGSQDSFWTASGPESPGTLEFIQKSKAYKITTHQNQASTLPLTFGTVPTVVNNPVIQPQVLTSDDIYIPEPIISTGNTSTTHEINLVQGWNIFSTYIDTSISLNISPDAGFWAEYAYNTDNTAINVNSLGNYVLLMKNNAAAVVWPDFHFNGIGNFNSTEGYQIKVAQPMKLIITGEETTNKVWDLAEGWNIVSWPFVASNDVIESIPSEYRDKILLIKNNNAEVYWPEFNFNGIGSFIPGQGYQIKVSQALTIPLNSPAV